MVNTYMETQDIPNFILWYEVKPLDPAKLQSKWTKFQRQATTKNPELNEMYLDRTAIIVFSIFAYWSSTHSSTLATDYPSVWSQQFSDGATLMFRIMKANCPVRISLILKW
jgi:hypothetical protein